MSHVGSGLAAARLLGLPSGKSLEEATLALLKEAHAIVKRHHPRECLAEIEGLPGFSRAVSVKPSQAPELVAEGTLIAAFTGDDNVLESGADVVVCTSFPFSRATNRGTRCVLFSRSGQAVDDALVMLAGKEETVRVVSEYPRATAAFFEARRIHAEVVPCNGSAEALVVVGRYDWGVALTETGTSLKVNGLAEVATIFESQTVLIANKAAYARPEVKADVDFLGKLIQGVLEARDKRYITMNAPLASVEGIKKVLPSLKSPTIQSLGDEGYYAISSVVPVKGLAELKRTLLELGATGIVELDHVSVI